LLRANKILAADRREQAAEQQDQFKKLFQSVGEIRGAAGGGAAAPLHVG
jgi:hypothetical protein